MAPTHLVLLSCRGGHHLIQGSLYKVSISVKDHGRFAQRGMLKLIRSSFCRGQELVTVVLNGVVGILERVAREQQNDAVFCAHASICSQLLQAGKRDGAGWLAANALRADLSFGKRNL